MPINGKTADELREEFFAALDRERDERAASRRDFEARMAEANARLDRTDAQLDRTDAQLARTDAQLARTDAQLARFGEQTEDLDKRWGNYTRGDSRQLEGEGMLALDDLTELGGMEVVGMSVPFRLGKKGREYDGLLYCREAAVLVEFKRRLGREDVEKFAREQLVAFAAEAFWLRGLPVYGAVAGAVIDDDARALAEEEGLFVIHLPAHRRVVVLNERVRPRGNGDGDGNGKAGKDSAGGG